MDNLDFWLAAGGMTAGVAGLLFLSARAGAKAQNAQAAAGRQDANGDATKDIQPDLQVYKDQLREVEADLARGTLPASEAERLRTEIARRLLEADRALREAPRKVVAKGGLWITGAAILMAGAAALWTYDRVGLPGYPDMPLKQRLAEADQIMALRPAQADYIRGLPKPAPVTTDAEYLDLLKKLRAAVDPATATDLRGLELLSTNEAALGNFAEAIAAQRRLIAVKGDDARAPDHAALADLLIRQAAGYVSPEAEAELAAALKMDPRDGLARYYTGLMFAQGGRFDRAFAIWRPLLEQGPQDAPWIAPLRAQIGEVAARAGVNYTVPEQSPLAGPGRADVEAAAELSDDERAAMIEGMVTQLSDRLASEGGTAAEWAQLIRALGVLGRTAEAEAIATEARAIFANAPDALAEIEAALSAGGDRP